MQTLENEPHIVINADRTITVPPELRDIAVQYDHNVQTVTFDCPRYWDDIDMSKMIISIDYTLPNGIEDSYVCPKVTVDDADDSVIHFTWTILSDVTQESGTIEFLVCIKELDTDEVVLYAWHSKIYEGLNVLEGKYCSDKVMSDYEAGVKSVKNPLEYAKDLSNMYYTVDFPNDYELVINAPLANNFNYLCKTATGLKSVTFIGNIANDVLDIAEAFLNVTSLELVDVENCNFKIYDATRTFSGCTKLKEIKGVIDVSHVIAGVDVFKGCSALEEIRFKPSSLKMTFAMTDSPLLSAESLQSIIDCLTTVSTRQTLYLHADAVSRLTEDQLSQIEAKNWAVQAV